MKINPISVTELNKYVKDRISEDEYLNNVLVKGEISNFKHHYTGHLYFTLKDDASRISAVMFYSSAISINFAPEDGMNVLVEGRISCYPAQGTYQIYVDKMEPDGLGNLYIEFEKLKEKLAKEGLFSSEHKKAIPKIPKKIGVITASTGAAIRDIISTIKRRFPICEVILFPALVQGRDAAPDIVRQIKRADEFGVDTIIVGRGGGSIEDLWAFNEEIVAKAIFECKTPIISAVGHEIDWTIADFVADLRAPTPTGAAEMAVPTILDINTIINNYKIRLNKNVKNMVNTKFIKLRSIRNSFVLKNPMAMYDVKEQKLDTLMEKLNNDIKNIIDSKEFSLNKINLSYCITNPMVLIEKKKVKYDLLINTLKLVNPLGILEKGYSLVEIDKRIIKSSKDVTKDDIINIKLHEGEINAKVMEVK